MQPDDSYEKLEAPDSEIIEGLIEGMKFLAGLAPVMGTSFAAVIGYYGQRAISERQQRFLSDVIRHIERLEVDVESLRANQAFWTTFFHALEIAQRTHQVQKLVALRNAVVHAALPSAPNDDLQAIFLSLVDVLSDLHLRVLSFLLFPERFNPDLEDFRSLHTGIDPRKPRAVPSMLEAHLAASGRMDLVWVCIGDLVSRGLLAYEGGVPGRLQDYLLPWPTELSWEFHHFISTVECAQE